MKLKIFTDTEYNKKKRKWNLVFYRERKDGSGKMYAAIYCRNEEEAIELSNLINFGKIKARRK